MTSVLIRAFALVLTIVFISSAVGFVLYLFLLRRVLRTVAALLRPIDEAVQSAVAQASKDKTALSSIDVNLAAAVQQLAGANALVERIEQAEYRLDALESRHLRTPNVH